MLEYMSSGNKDFFVFDNLFSPTTDNNFSSWLGHASHANSQAQMIPQNTNANQNQNRNSNDDNGNSNSKLNQSQNQQLMNLPTNNMANNTSMNMSLGNFGLPMQFSHFNVNDPQQFNVNQANNRRLSLNLMASNNYSNWTEVDPLYFNNNPIRNFSVNNNVPQIPDNYSNVNSQQMQNNYLEFHNEDFGAFVSADQALLNSDERQKTVKKSKSKKNRLMPRKTSANSSTKDKQFWTKEEDDKLVQAVEQCSGRNWRTISELSGVGRSDIQCLQRWNQVLKPGLKKGAWSPEEDSLLYEVVTKIIEGHEHSIADLDHEIESHNDRSEGEGNKKISWKIVEKYMGGRTAKQCRERWKLSLDPAINKGPWTEEEDHMLLNLQKQHSNSWALIKDLLQTRRTENAVKLRFKCLKKNSIKASPLEIKSVKRKHSADDESQTSFKKHESWKDNDDNFDDMVQKLKDQTHH